MDQAAVLTVLAQFYHSMTAADPRLYAIGAQNDL
jgi:hypothetical protein